MEFVITPKLCIELFLIGHSFRSMDDRSSDQTTNIDFICILIDRFHQLILCASIAFFTGLLLLGRIDYGL